MENRTFDSDIEIVENFVEKAISLFNVFTEEYLPLFTDYIFPIAAIIFLVVAAGFFSSSETAFLSITKIQIRHLLKSEYGKKKLVVKKISKLKSDMDGFLTLVLIGTNFVNTLSPALATAFFIRLLGEEKGATTSTLTMSFVIIIFAEIIPKTLAAVHPIPVAKHAAGSLLLLRKILAPLVVLFSKVTKGIGQIVSKLWKNDEKVITEEELKKLIEVGETEGTIEQSEKKILYKIIAMTDLKVRDIMKHRSLVKSISIDATYKETIRTFVETGYSRLPVYKDNPDNIVGLIFYKTVLFNGTKSKDFEEQGFVKKCRRSVLFIPETLSALEMLQTFKRENTRFAVAVDENGENSGIVTMEDLLKAVLGLSVDQYSASDIPVEKRIELISTTEMLVPGDIKLEEFNNYLGYNLESEDFDTLGGWVLEQFGYLPQNGEIILRNGVMYRIESQEKRRIQKIRITTRKR